MYSKKDHKWDMKGTAPKTTPMSVMGGQGMPVTGKVTKSHHMMRPTGSKKFPPK